MSSTVNLTANMSSCLYALKATSKSIEETNNRLSTGLKVNSALDDPLSYFAAEDHTADANALSLLNNDMNEAIETINAADEGIESIKDLLDDAKALCNSALSADTTGEAADYMEQFNDLLEQIDSIAEDSGYGGINLLGGTGETLEVKFNEDGSSSLTLTGIDASTDSTGLNITTQSGWSSASAISTTTINAAISAVNDAKSELRSASKTLSTQLSTVTARQEFTEGMMEVLNNGAADLVNADLNEESANLLALQTQQSLGTNSLSIASSSMQSVLNLF